MSPRSIDIVLAHRLFPGTSVLVRTGLSEPEPSALSTEERAAVAQASPKRVDDYCRGRAAAHRLLEALDVRCASLLNDIDGVPQWPRGIVASLSHTQGLAVACGASAQRVRALGIDAEPTDRVLSSMAWRYVFCEHESVALTALPAMLREDWAMRLFSLKESAY